MLQKINDLDKLCLGFVHARHIGERDLLLFAPVVDLGAIAPKLKRFSPLSGKAAEGP